MVMHAVAREMRRTRGVDDAESEDDDEGEMDNFQELQLGSLAPLVCLEEFDVIFLSSNRFLQNMRRIFEL